MNLFLILSSQLSSTQPEFLIFHRSKEQKSDNLRADRWILQLRRACPSPPMILKIRPSTNVVRVATIVRAAASIFCAAPSSAKIKSKPCSYSSKYELNGANQEN
ncbi:hypothetical protein KSP40_PGU004437 [Platanthera guangdongensis]|uniref:Uncharacterized protein n=1 Tax=Platanthera guangdongensis TaxID=2320717 RepID=A0ABR2LR83_9ASPA